MSTIEATRILLVDDDVGVLSALTTLLGAMGFSVLSAKTPLEAIRAARTESINVVLADATIVPTSGAVLLDTVQTRFPHIATALMSGYTPEELQRLGVHVGNHQFVPKPFRTFEVVEAIGEALDAVRTPASAS